MNPNLKFNQYSKSGAIMTSDGWVRKNQGSRSVKIDWLPVMVVMVIILVCLVVVVVK
jgi:hypothetical protein